LCYKFFLLRRVKEKGEGLSDYVPVLYFLLVSIVFCLVAFFIARLVRPSKPHPVKLEPYECGIEPLVGARDRFSIRYYVIAILFVVFDVETIFLYPWAILYDKLLIFGLVEMGLFIVILLFGYYYAWKKGALEWA
jgi:NADH-quinone oxidoreductase subunit A